MPAGGAAGVPCARIKGMGSVKLDTYGAEILEIVARGQE